MIAGIVMGVTFMSLVEKGDFKKRQFVDWFALVAVGMTWPASLIELCIEAWRLNKAEKEEE